MQRYRKIASSLRTRLLPPAALLACSILYYAVPLYKWPAVSYTAGVLFLVFFSLMLPGYVLRKALSPDDTDLLEKAASSFLIGLSYLLLVSFLWSVLGRGLRSLESLYPLSLLPVALLSLLRKGHLSPPSQRAPARWGDKIFVYTFYLVIIVTFLAVLRSGPPLDFTKDTIDHVGYVREIGESGRIFPSKAFYIEGGSNGLDIRKGLLNFVYGFYSDYLGIGALDLLKIINAVFAVVILLSAYGAALLLFKSQKLAVLSSVFLLLNVDGGLRGAFIRESFYPNRFGMVFFFYFLASSLHFLEDRKTMHLLKCALFAFASSAAHIFYTILFGSSVAVIAAWKTCFPKAGTRIHFSTAVLIGLATVLGFAPYMAFRLLTSYQGANALHTEVQGVVYITKNLFIADPVKLWHWFGPFGLICFLALVPLWRVRRNNHGLGFLVASFLTIPLVLFNPIALPLLHRVMTYLVFRLQYLCPFYMLGAYFAFHSLPIISERGRSSLLNALLLTALLFTVLLNLLPFFKGNTFSSARLSMERKSSHLLWSDGLAFLSHHLPERSVIASDPVTSYSIPAFTSHYVVCTLDQHAPPNDLRLAERIKSARAIFSPFVPMRKTTELLHSSGASYLILNNRFGRDLDLHYWSIDQSSFPEVLRKFSSQPELFETVFDKNGFSVLRWNGMKPLQDDEVENPYYLSEVPERFEKLGRRAGSARLEAFRFEKDVARRGGILDISLVWSIIHRLPLGNYIVSVRFDHLDPGLPFSGRPFPKIIRKAKEVLIGSRYRFRSDHKIVSGFLSPDVWPIGTYVLDEKQVAIPRDLVPGRYGVFVKLLRLTDQPNYSLRDIFQDVDIYQGVKIGEVTID